MKHDIEIILGDAGQARGTEVWVDGKRIQLVTKVWFELTVEGFATVYIQKFVAKDEESEKPEVSMSADGDLLKTVILIEGEMEISVRLPTEREPEL